MLAFGLEAEEHSLQDKIEFDSPESRNLCFHGGSDHQWSDTSAISFAPRRLIHTVAAVNGRGSKSQAPDGEDENPPGPESLEWVDGFLAAM